MVDDPTKRFCLPVDQVHSLAKIGGKAINLARIASLGLSIPNSIVITTSALDYFLKETGLHERVAPFLIELTGQGNGRQRATYERLCQDVMTTDKRVKYK